MRGDTEHRQPLIGNKFKILPHVGGRKASYAMLQQIFGKQGFAFHGFLHHLKDTPFHVGIEQVRLFALDGIDNLERKRHMGALVAKDPICTRCKAVQEPPRTKKIDISERCKKEQAFDTSSKTNEV